MSQSLVNEGRFPHFVEGGVVFAFLSQSLVNEGRFPPEEPVLITEPLDVAIPR